MELSNSYSLLSFLFKVVYKKLNNAQNLEPKIDGCFSLFKYILHFSLEFLEKYFESGYFKNKEHLKTIYGSIVCCNISEVLKNKLLSKKMSLVRLCLLSITKNPPLLFKIDDLLALPSNLIEEFLILVCLKFNNTLEFCNILDSNVPFSVSLWFNGYKYFEII